MIYRNGSEHLAACYTEGRAGGEWREAIETMMSVESEHVTLIGNVVHGADWRTDIGQNTGWEGEPS